MIKRGVAFIFTALIFSMFLFAHVYADNSNSTQLDKAYQCLKDKIGSDCSKLTPEEQAFAVLSLGDYKNCKDSFFSNSKTQNSQQCWPSGNCKVKDTAIALLALDRINSDTANAQNWLLNQTKSATDLIWYLEIESQSATTCKIIYDGRSYSTNILSDKTISSGAGLCLSVSENSYWLKVSSNCLDKEFTISCDKDFTTTLLYKSTDSSTIRVSQIVNSASANGETTEKVIYKCFKEGTVCNYESSLWASIALNRKSIDINSFIPYLDSYADSNLKSFPSAFLYILTDSDDSLSSLLKDNFKGSYWDAPNTYGKFYNTATALLALQSYTSIETDSVKQFLLNGNTQNSAGCWNSFRDTGFLLYSGWPLPSSSGTSSECTKNSDCKTSEECLHGICIASSSAQSCTSQNHYCVNSADCSRVGGITFSNLDCSSFNQVCCSENTPAVQSCSEQSGYICNTGEVCNADILKSADYGVCCSKACEQKPVQAASECENSGYSCRVSCLSGESENPSLSCANSGVGKCCIPQASSSGGSYLWIWILLILIVLAVVAIIFREKIKIFIFRSKNKFRKGPAPKETRPPFFPPAGARPRFPLPRPVIRPSSARPLPSRSGSGKDREFDETLKKLKEMSK